MEKAILNVNGMSCEHCVRAVTKAVGALPGVDGVSVDLKAKTVAVEYDPQKSALDAIKFAIEDQGYDVVS
ncbi:MAG: copper chaperone CopZ [Bacillota bacterium]